MTDTDRPAPRDEPANWPLTMSALERHFATFVISAINAVWTEPCCADCCAPCHSLRELAQSGDLDAVVMTAPEHLWRGSEWWVDGKVDREWLFSRWDCTSRPRCDHDEEDEN